jgi:enamine deaminase RidA (YjgF/YER057c/UK114 family)
MSDSKTKAPVQAANHGVAWEKAFGYAQAIKVKDTIYVSGQLSHDSAGNLVAPADLNEAEKPRSFDKMEAQIRQTYENARILLAQFGASFDDVEEETLYVLDVIRAGRRRGVQRGFEGSQAGLWSRDTAAREQPYWRVTTRLPATVR